MHCLIMETKKKKEVEKQLVRFDWAIKRLLRHKADYVVVEGLLTVLLGEKITITSPPLESESNKDTPEARLNRVDVLVTNDKGELFLIEVQNSYEADFLLRMQYGVAKAITEHIKEGEPYSKVKKVYHIDIVYFDLGHGKDYVYHGTTRFIGLHEKDELQLDEKQRKAFGKEYIHEILPEYYILKVNDFDKVARDSLDQWFYFLKNSEIPAEFDAPGLPEARRKLQKSKFTSEELREYDRHIDELRGKWSMIWSAKLEGQIEAEKENRKEQLKLKKALKEKDAALKQEKAAHKAKDKELKQLQAASAAKDEALAAKETELKRLRQMLENSVRTT